MAEGIETRNQNQQPTTHAMDMEPVSVDEDFDQYVLLLIDATSHTFADDFGQSSTLPIDFRLMRERLHASINQYMSDLDSELTNTYRIFVRAYAALDKIPRGHLNNFFAGFSSADPHFDFTLLLSETFVEERINDGFQAAMEDHRCKHIMLAAWGRTSYLRLLQPPLANVTLVQGTSMGAGVEALTLHVPTIVLPQIFLPPKKIDTMRATLAHLPLEGTSSIDLFRIMDDREYCAARKCGQDHAQCQPSLTIKTITHSIENNKGRIQGHMPSRSKPGHVPLNRVGQRLDTVLEYPETSHYLEFANHFSRHGLQSCNWHHLEEGCFIGDKRLCDQSDLNEKVYKFMQFKARLVPCIEGTQCRRSTCPFGHVCQSKKCIGKDVKDCPLKVFHRVHPVVVQWVKGTDIQKSAAYEQTCIGWRPM